MSKDNSLRFLSELEKLSVVATSTLEQIRTGQILFKLR
jgi:hypothetical protein